MNKTYKALLITAFFICFIVGFKLGTHINAKFINNYPLVKCIYDVDKGLNVDNNNLPFTKESQREAIQLRCAQEIIDFNKTLNETLVYVGD